jgi:hypothetical protein
VAGLGSQHERVDAQQLDGGGVAFLDRQVEQQVSQPLRDSSSSSWPGLQPA